MVKAGTGGQTNVTQSNSTGNQKMDISPIDEVNNAENLTDITDLYTNLAHQYGGIVDKSAQDVTDRQTSRIGNDFGGAADPYNYSQYYMPASTGFQSTMRVEGTQRALEEGMDRAKAEAEARANAAKNEYENANSKLQKLQAARQNPTIVEAGKVGNGTSAMELLDYYNASQAKTADEFAGRVNSNLLSDTLVSNTENWNIRAYRDVAKTATLNKFGISQDKYNNMTKEERDNFWSRADVGTYWTNQYAYKYATETYGKKIADEYQAAYDYNYNAARQVFDNIKSAGKSLETCISSFRAIQFNAKDIIPSGQVRYSYNTGTIQIGDTKYTLDDSEAAEKGEKNSQGVQSVFSIIDEADKKKIKEELNKIDDMKRHLNYSAGTRQSQEQDINREIDKLERDIANAVAKSPQAAQDVVKRREISFATDYENVNSIVEDAFGVDLESIHYLNEMRNNDPDKFNGLLSDYALVQTYGQVFDIADGKKTYHTAQGDKVLPEGTYVMYTLPGFQDADGNILESNLKRYLELRSENFDATMSDKELQEETKKALEGYQKVVQAALAEAYRSDCDVNSDILHQAIYASSPSNKDYKELSVLNGHTVGEVLEKFSELTNKDPEAAYAMFTEIVKKASANSGSMMANYGGRLTSLSTKDEAGRDMVGSELTSGSQRASTLFDENDIANLTVEGATALLGTLGTSMDLWNKGTKDGNISTDFLTADGNNWFKNFSIEAIKGVTSLIDLVGNILWTGTSALATQIGTLIEGRGGKWTEEEYDRVFKNGRWWGWGGITGNWTGNSSIYDQFVGEYKNTAFGYGESNQNRMTDNLLHLVNPILEDLWFSENQNLQKAMGTGRGSDEGLNYRNISNFTSSMAGFVTGIFLGNLAAKGVAAGISATRNLITKSSSAMANALKSGMAKSFLEGTTRVVDNLLKGAQGVAEFAAGSKVDDAARAANASDDIVREATASYLDDATNAATGGIASSSDDTLRGMGVKNIGKTKSGVTYADTLSSYGSTASKVARAQELFIGAADDEAKALGFMAASATGETLAGLSDDIYTFSAKLFKKLIKQIPGLSADESAKIIKDLGKVTTKRALNLAYISASTKVPITELENLSDEALTVLTNLMNYKNGVNIGKVPTQISKYLDSLSTKEVTELVKGMSERAGIKAAANKGMSIWSNEDTVRFLAKNGWDSKRITILTKDWLRDQLQDLTSDVLYGYIKPTVSNEGTDRETIDEYFTNPMNYLFNLGASGLQFVGGRVLNRIGQPIANTQLDRAQRALSRAVDSGADTDAIEKLSRKVLKKVDNAMNFADRALERGKTLAQVKELTDKSLAYCDEAVNDINVVSIRTKPQLVFNSEIRDIPALSKQLNETQLGFLRTLYSVHTAGTASANARYFQLKKALGTYTNGLGSITDQATNGHIWRLLIEGKENYLNKLRDAGKAIEVGNVTLGEQRQIYKAMIDHVMDSDVAKTIPGLRNALNNFTDELLRNAEVNKYETMRAGYLPIESFLNVNDSTPAALRGFSAGEWVLDSATANPYLERSEQLSDKNIIEAILRGDKEITLKDKNGADIVDANGVVETRLLNPDGLNFLDAITCADNAAWYHRNIDPILGKNNAEAGAAAAKNGLIIINQDGILKVALDKSIKKTSDRIKEIENSVLGNAAPEEQAKAIQKSKRRAKIIAEKNPEIKDAAAAKKVVKKVVQTELEKLDGYRTKLTTRQSEFPSIIFGFYDGTGKIDIDAGNKVFDRYTSIVKNDIKKYQNGELGVGSKIDTAFRRYDNFAWKYGRDELFDSAVAGYKHTYEVDSEYFQMLKYCADNGVAPTKDMVMRRLLWTEQSTPTNKNGEAFVSISEKYSKTGKKTITKYEWSSPFAYARTSHLNESGVSNALLREFQMRGYGEGVNTNNFYYVPSKNAKPWTAAQFDSLVLDSPANIAKAKDIIIQNAERGKINLPLTKGGKVNKVAQDMLDVVTAEIMTKAKGGSGVAPIDVSFSTYVDMLSTMMANSKLLNQAFDPKSNFYDVFKKINTYQSNGGSNRELGDYILEMIAVKQDTPAEFSKYLEAYAILGAMDDNRSRAIGLGDNFDAGKSFDDEGVELVHGLLFESSDEAIAQSAQGAGKNPLTQARINEILEKGPAEAGATDEELRDLGLGYLGRAGERSGKFKTAQTALALQHHAQTNSDDFAKALGSFKKVLDEYMDGDEYKARQSARFKVQDKLDGKGKNDTGLTGRVNDLINKAAATKEGKNIKKKISEYAATRKHRQKAYAVNEDETFDAIKAYGATNKGYTVVDNPLEFRSASQNYNISKMNRGELIHATDFSENPNSLVSLEQALKDAIKEDRSLSGKYKKLVKSIGEKKAKKTQLYKDMLRAKGEVDEARKRFSQRQTDLGIDLSNDMQHSPDWSGFNVAYDTMMLEGGKTGSRIEQLKRAIVKVKEDLGPTGDKKLIDELNSAYDELVELGYQTPDWDFFNPNELVSTDNSLELQLLNAMSSVDEGSMIDQTNHYRILPDGSREIVDTKPTNGIFTEEMLNSVAPIESGKDLSFGDGNPHRLDYDVTDNGTQIGYRSDKSGAGYQKTTVDFGNYKNVVFEVWGQNVEDTANGATATLMLPNGDYIDVNTLSPSEISSLNEALAQKGTPYRVGVVDDSAVDTAPTYNYGELQPKYDKLVANENRAKTVLEYHRLKNEGGDSEKIATAMIPQFGLNSKEVSMSLKKASDNYDKARNAISEFTTKNKDARQEIKAGHKEFTYGAAEPEFKKLSAISDKANAVLEYKNMESKLGKAPSAQERADLEAFNAAHKGNFSGDTTLSYDDKLAELNKFKSDNKLSDSDVKISYEDAQTNAWMAKKELDDFTGSHKQELVDTNPTVENINTRIAKLKEQEKVLVEREADARSLGDLKENEEYHAARRELAQTRDEITELEELKKTKSATTETNGSRSNITIVPLDASESEAISNITFSSDEVSSYGNTNSDNLVPVRDENDNIMLDENGKEMYKEYPAIRTLKLKNYEEKGLVSETPSGGIDDGTDYLPVEYQDNPNYNVDALYTEWLSYTKDLDELDKAISREQERVSKKGKKIEKDADKELNKKVKDPDDPNKKVSYNEAATSDFEARMKKAATPEEFEEWKRLNEHLEYARSVKADKKAKLFRDQNGVIYLSDKSPNIAGYASHQNQLEARGYKPTKKKTELPPVDEKADKKVTRQMQKAITKNRHAGDVFDSRLEDWDLPRDKNGKIILDDASKRATIKNLETIYNQVRNLTGLDIKREGMLMSNEYADLLTRIPDESVRAGRLQRGINALSSASQSIQNAQLAGGLSFVNAYSIAQLRDAVMRNPLMAKEYAKVVGSMKNSAAVEMFALENNQLLTRFTLETGDLSIVNDFTVATSTKPGYSDGGVAQNVINNLLHLKKDFVDARVQNDGSIPKALKAIVSKDIQNTIFEDATFANAMPVLRAKMLTANYDAALNQLSRKFKDAPQAVLEKAAIKMSYARTQSFFDPYHTMGKGVTEVLDNTYSKAMRTFAASFTNSKSQTTVLDTLTNFFFALRYKMMLAGRVYDSAASPLIMANKKFKGRGITELTADNMDEVLDSFGSSFMEHSAAWGAVSLTACAATAAVTAAALGIPTAWNDVSWIDEYDGSFKIPDILLKFQTIGQIWLPNAYSDERGFYVDPTQKQFGIDTMSSIFTLQNSFFRTIDRTINPETYYAAPQRGVGLLGQEIGINPQGLNDFLNTPLLRAIGDEAIGSNLLSPFKAMYEVIMDSTYFGNNVWEKKYLPDGKENPNYDPGRNFAAMTMHILGLDQVLDGGKGYNDWVKGKGTAKYVEQDQIGTVAGSGILQHEFLSAARSMMNGDYLDAVTEAGELPFKSQNLSSKARTEFNTRVKNLIAGYNDEYKAIVKNPDSNNDVKDAAYKDYAKKTADVVATWSKKYGYVLGEDQKLVPYVSRTMMAMLSGEYDDNMYYVQDAYWKASADAQIEGVTSANYWLDDADLKEWIAAGKTAEEFAEEKKKRTKAYNDAQNAEYDARNALIEANIDIDGNEKIKGLKDFFTSKYSYSDLKAEQRILNKEIYTSIHSKLDMPIGDFDNFKEMKNYYETLINNTTSTNQKVNLAMRYNTYVFDLIAPYAEKYGANIVNDAYYNGKGLAADLSDYVILPANKKYYGKSPVSSYIKDVFNVGFRNDDALPSDKEVYEKFIVAQNLMYKGSIASSISVLDTIIDQIKKNRLYASNSDYNKIINMRAYLSARSK